jgi:hypothetical protein
VSVEQQRTMSGGDLEPSDHGYRVTAEPLPQLVHQRIREPEDRVSIAMPPDELVPAIHQRVRGGPRCDQLEIV